MLGSNLKTETGCLLCSSDSPFRIWDCTLSYAFTVSLHILSSFVFTNPVIGLLYNLKYVKTRLQILQSKCLRVIGNYPRRTPVPRLHTALNVALIHDFFYHLTDDFFSSCPAHPNPLVRSIGQLHLS